MRQQHEITTSGPLLGSDGNLLEPGWARSLLPVYRRADIKASAMRIKEWDYYLITDGHIGLALTIADNGYMGLDSVSFLDFDGKWEKTTSRMRALPLGRTQPPSRPRPGSSASRSTIQASPSARSRWPICLTGSTVWTRRVRANPAARASAFPSRRRF